ncbi:hypothetical protein [Campylobacter concisus]|nr:hypothetical protein [Campylobacter concisus]
MAVWRGVKNLKALAKSFLFRRDEILFLSEASKLNFKIRLDKNIYPDVKI